MKNDGNECVYFNSKSLKKASTSHY